MAVRDAETDRADRRRSAWLGAALCLATALDLVRCGGAWADSGDFAAVVDGATDYILPAASCTELNAVLASNPELVLACSIGGRPASPGPDDSPCDLVSGATNAGLALGQCLTDDYPEPFLVVTPGSGALETGTNINATAAGNNLALGDRDQISVTAVGTGGGTVLGLVDVQAGSCPSGGCPSSCGSIPVIPSQEACDVVEERLAASVLSDPPALSHALFLDLEETGTAGVLKVAVCNGYRWSCRAPGTTLAATGFRGQVPFSIVDTPICVRLTRSTRCP